MKIIVIGPNYDNYKSASYQYEFMEHLKSSSESYYHYQGNLITIKQLISLSKFKPEIIFYNHGWLSDNVTLEDLKYTKVQGLRNTDIKHVVFLNKEYVLLEEKLKEIKKFKFDLIFTHWHTLEKFNNTGIKSIFLPLAFSSRHMTKKSHKKLSERKYDLYFSGILQNWDRKETQGDLRKKIQNELFYCLFDFPIFKKFKYRSLKIYWKPFYKNRIKNIFSNFIHGKRLNQEDYFNTLANSKCVLHTASPLGIISTRVFEALGSGAVGLFSDESNANIIFENKVHYLGFNNIDDFINKIYQVKNSSTLTLFQKIADKGRLCIENEHDWKNRVLKFKEEVSKI